MAFETLLIAIARVLAFVGVGLALRASGLVKPAESKVLMNLIVYVGLPAFIFQAIHPAALGWDLAVIAGIGWIVIIATMLVAWVAARRLGLKRATLGAFIICAALGNTGYIGYPIARELLGETGLVRAVFFDIFATVAALLLVGLYVAEKTGESGERARPLRDLLTFPAVIALFAALALRPVAIPMQVSSWLDALASLVVPLVMISVGLSLRPAAVAKYAVPIAVLAGIKLVGQPLLAVAAAQATGQSADVTKLVALQAGMPTMMLSLVIGMRFGLDKDFIAAAILVTTIASAAAIPLVQMLLG